MIIDSQDCVGDDEQPGPSPRLTAALPVRSLQAAEVLEALGHPTGLICILSGRGRRNGRLGLDG